MEYYTQEKAREIIDNAKIVVNEVKQYLKINMRPNGEGIIKKETFQQTFL